MLKYLIVIPARLKSKRLPDKPLLNIGGIPMIIRTYHQCLKVVPAEKIVIATDSNKIKKVCEKYNAKCIITSKNCLTGTDRVAEVSKKIEAKNYINVQGDEPFFNPDDLKKLIFASIKYPNLIINGYTPIKSKKLFYNISIPKVVIDKKEFLIYMSRAPIPSNKEKKFIYGWRQICAYSFPKKSLKIFSRQRKKSFIENIEDIEILRFLELGIKIKMIKMSNKSMSIDNQEDYKRAKKYIELNKL